MSRADRNPPFTAGRTSRSVPVHRPESAVSTRYPRASAGRPCTVAEAEARQEVLRAQVVTVDDHPPLVTAAGLDMAYDTGSDRAAAAVVVLEVATLARIDAAVALGRADFPYAPGLLAFREAPLLIEAYERLVGVPDVLVCDGHGIAHPRRIGLASHLGVLLDRPSVGVAKTPFLGAHGPLGDRRGATADIVDGGEVIGRALRTQDGVRPVFVSVGHRVGLDTACHLVLALAPRHRLPETTRQADSASRAALRRVVRENRPRPGG
jgi:deoxyribonuclease V